MTGSGKAMSREIGSLFCEAYLRPVWQLKTEATIGGDAPDLISNCCFCIYLGRGVRQGGGNGIEL